MPLAKEKVEVEARINPIATRILLAFKERGFVFAGACSQNNVIMKDFSFSGEVDHNDQFDTIPFLMAPPCKLT